LTILTFAIVNALYLVIMRLFSVQRINSIITSVQIGFSALLYGSFQILPSMLDMSEIENIHLSEIRFVWLFPAYWLGCAWKFLSTLDMAPNLIVGAALSVVVPLMSVWLMAKYLAPSFMQKLSMMSGSGNDQEEDKKRSKPDRRVSSDRLGMCSRLFTSGEAEHQSYLLVGRMVSRNRDFKLKIYPMIGYIGVLFVLMVINKWDKIDFQNLNLETSGLKSSFLLTVYLSCIICISALYQLPYSDQYKAAWIYYSTPLGRPGVILTGAVKACMVKFYLPFVVIITLASLFLFGVSIVPNLVFGFSSVFLAILLYALFLSDKLPFSMPIKKAAENQSFFRNIAMIIFLPVFGIPQYFLFDYSWVLLGSSVVVWGGVLIAIKYIRAKQWAELEKE